MSEMREKKSKCQKKTFFFPSVFFFEKKMNDKRNLICGNVMLLSQSRDETSLSVFAKIRFEKKKSKSYPLVVDL